MDATTIRVKAVQTIQTVPTKALADIDDAGERQILTGLVERAARVIESQTDEWLYKWARSGVSESLRYSQIIGAAAKTLRAELKGALPTSDDPVEILLALS